MRASSSVDVRRWVKKHHAYLFEAQKNPASPMDALKSLVGSTVKVVKRGNAIVAEVVKGVSKATKRKNPAGFMAGGKFHPIRSGERWTRDKQGAIYMNQDKTPYSAKKAGEVKKKKAATKRRRKNPVAGVTRVELGKNRQGQYIIRLKAGSRTVETLGGWSYRVDGQALAKEMANQNGVPLKMTAKERKY
jgi:hypothetical protein